MVLIYMYIDVYLMEIVSSWAVAVILVEEDRQPVLCLQFPCLCFLYFRINSWDSSFHWMCFPMSCAYSWSLVAIKLLQSSILLQVQSLGIFLTQMNINCVLIMYISDSTFEMRMINLKGTPAVRQTLKLQWVVCHVATNPVLPVTMH